MGTTISASNSFCYTLRGEKRDCNYLTYMNKTQKQLLCPVNSIPSLKAGFNYFLLETTDSLSAAKPKISVPNLNKYEMNTDIVAAHFHNCYPFKDIELDFRNNIW